MYMSCDEQWHALMLEPELHCTNDERVMLLSDPIGHKKYWTNVAKCIHP